MHYEDFKSVIKECIQNPDTLTDKADELLEAVKLAYDTTEAQAQEIDALKSKNNDLRDTNTKLLMRQTFMEPKETEPVKKSADEIMQEIINKIQS
jgi:hypothetical protein